ncbi:hypothetical protein M422DRAFT_275507 [Sphaerobolus stellatus SS14]|uniref:Uncharacterized protein n=1 Tax=Sphaerobolus stellatus (strain SS14) TaxID=990650 RepID=A0A0C9UEE8_SPHS4|nr:hypothetical protein M422DRAFT_275507 [Sphaerobolus stellatus SS14]
MITRRRNPLDAGSLGSVSASKLPDAVSPAADGLLSSRPPTTPTFGSSPPRLGTPLPDGPIDPFWGYDEVLNRVTPDQDLVADLEQSSAIQLSVTKTPTRRELEIVPEPEPLPVTQPSVAQVPKRRWPEFEDDNIPGWLILVNPIVDYDSTEPVHYLRIRKAARRELIDGDQFWITTPNMSFIPEAPNEIATPIMASDGRLGVHEWCEHITLWYIS